MNFMSILSLVVTGLCGAWLLGLGIFVFIKKRKNKKEAEAAIKKVEKDVNEEIGK